MGSGLWRKSAIRSSIALPGAGGGEAFLPPSLPSDPLSHRAAGRTTASHPGGSPLSVIKAFHLVQTIRCLLGSLKMKEKHNAPEITNVKSFGHKAIPEMMDVSPPSSLAANQDEALWTSVFSSLTE